MRLDEREDSEEEQEIQVQGLTFVVGNDVIDSYGSKYCIAVTDDGRPGVTAG